MKPRTVEVMIELVTDRNEASIKRLIKDAFGWGDDKFVEIRVNVIRPTKPKARKGRGAR